MKMSKYSDELSSDADSRDITTVRQRLTQEYLGEIQDTHDELYDKVDYDDEALAEAWFLKEGERGNKCRNWCFTWNNYPEDYFEILKNNFPTINYMVVGREICPSTGTPHLQGFISFVNEHKFGSKKKDGTYPINTLKGLMPQLHWSKMRTNARANIKYCRKDGDFFEIGTPPSGSGDRTDLKSICRSIVEGKLTMEQMYREYPDYMVRMNRGFKDLFFHLSKHRKQRAYIGWLYGASGSGKSETAVLNHPPEDIYRKIDGKPYWGDYNGQDVIVIDEFSCYTRDNPFGWVLSNFLQVLDKYAIPVEIKGGFVRLQATMIYITSFHHPSHYYPDFADLTQVLRRIDGIYLMNGNLPPTLDENLACYYYDDNRPPPVKHTFSFIEKHKLMKSAQSALARSTSIVPSLCSDEELVVSDRK